MKWYNRLWIKFVLEVVVTVLLWLTFTVFRNLLPKKYRFKDKAIRSLATDLGALFSNVAKRDDSIGEVLKKSQNLVTHFYDKYYNHQTNSVMELKEFVDGFDAADGLGEYEVVNNWAFTNLLMPKLSPVSTKHVQDVSQTSFISEVVFPCSGGNTVKFFMICNKSYMSESLAYEQQFAIPKGFKPMSLINNLFDLYDNRLYLSANGGSGRDTMTYSRLEHQGGNYIPKKKIFDDLLAEIVKFREAGEQRSYLIPGAPGTGKTSFCVELSLAVNGRVVKLDSAVFTNLTNASTRSIIENLECDFIIVDDIDRIRTHDMAAFLYVLETVKGYSRKPTLLATCNDISRLDLAVIRPGRFDDIVEGFSLPGIKERKEFIKTMLDKFNVVLTPAQISKFGKVTRGMSQAYLKEYCSQFRIDNDFDAVIAKIERRMTYLRGGKAILNMEDDVNIKASVEADSDED